MQDIISNQAPALLVAMPFIGLLLSLALIPLFFHHIWDKHFDKIILFWVALVLLGMVLQTGTAHAFHDILHTMVYDYFPFIILLSALFTIAGGIVVKGYFDGRPSRNIQLFLIGAVLSSFMGTMGSAMVLIRPLLRAANQRRYKTHMIIFFIILVGNVSGGLTPLGDPPLFFGFLRGVDFFWPLANLWKPVLITSIMLLVMFFAIDNYLWRREGGKVKKTKKPDNKFSIKVDYNVFFLGGVIGALLFSVLWSNETTVPIADMNVPLKSLMRDGFIMLLALLSYFTTSAASHRANNFNFAPLAELGVLFFGIFVTLIPVLSLLANDSATFTPYLADSTGKASATAYFYLVGFFSSVLDNAPTYLVFFQLAGGDAIELMAAKKDLLIAISLGAVFMGANTYIGNAPNFMIKTMAEHYKIKTPNFFLYSFYAVLILLPSYLIVTAFFLS